MFFKIFASIKISCCNFLFTTFGEKRASAQWMAIVNILNIVKFFIYKLQKYEELMNISKSFGCSFRTWGNIVI